MASAPQSEAHADPPSTSIFKVHIGTRKSKLALVQTDHVVLRLKDAWPSSQFEIFASNTEEGDLDKVTPLRELTGKNIWTYGLENLLIAGKLHMIVHSLKGMKQLSSQPASSESLSYSDTPRRPNQPPGNLYPRHHPQSRRPSRRPRRQKGPLLQFDRRPTRR